MSFELLRFNNAVYNDWFALNKAASKVIVEAIVAKFAEFNLNIYPYHRPQVTSPPTISYKITDRQFVECLFGSIGIATITIEFTIHSYVFSEVVTIADTINANLEGWHETLGDVEVIFTTSQSTSQATEVDLKSGNWVYEEKNSYEFRYRVNIPTFLGPNLIVNGTFADGWNAWTHDPDPLVYPDTLFGQGTTPGLKFSNLVGEPFSLDQVVTTEVGATYLISFLLFNHDPSDSLFYYLDPDMSTRHVIAQNIANNWTLPGVPWEFEVIATDTSTDVVFDTVGVSGDLYLTNISMRKEVVFG